MPDFGVALSYWISVSKTGGRHAILAIGAAALLLSLPAVAQAAAPERPRPTTAYSADEKKPAKKKVAKKTAKKKEKVEYMRAAPM